MYKAIGNRIVHVHNAGKPYEEVSDVALCDVPAEAIALMDKAHYLNDVKRRYTASARLLAQVEQLPGFSWLNQE